MTRMKILVMLSIMIAAGCGAEETMGRKQAVPMVPVESLTKIFSQKVMQSLQDAGDTVAYPRTAGPEGRWKTVSIYDWTSGFFPGILWYMSELTHDTAMTRAAERWTTGLTPIRFYAGSHDIGFMIYCSFGNGYRLTGSAAYKQTILQTAHTLTTRFNPVVGCIKSWDGQRWQYPVIIDNMMNLELLFWASKNGGAQHLYDVAVTHAETTMRNHFRSDGSTCHVVSYDTLSGNVLSKGTAQGYADSSCWARGQAWAIYGFTMTYRFTRDKRFLATAEHAADYFIGHLPADHVPYWDFNAPKIPNEPRDASAGAIAASALLELSGYATTIAGKEKYVNAAVSILSSLSSEAYLNTSTSGRGFLNHAVGHRPAGSEIDVSLIYGDYYFLEALVRYKQMQTLQ